MCNNAVVLDIGRAVELPDISLVYHKQWCNFLLYFETKQLSFAKLLVDLSSNRCDAICRLYNDRTDGSMSVRLSNVKREIVRCM